MTSPAEGGRFVRGLSEAQLLYLENLGNDLMVEVLAQVADHYADLLIETAAAKGAITAAAGEAPPPDGLPPGASFVDPQDLAGISAATSAAIAETVLPVVAEVYLSNATRVRAGMVEASGWVLPPVSSIDAYRYLRSAAPAFDEIGAGLWQNVRDELADGFVQGESIPQLAQRVRNAAGTSARTATLVARTSVIDAANKGSIETARASGLAMQKEWMATPDRRTRPTHRAADGQRVDLNAKFTVGGWPADHPGSAELPDSERRLCRCAIGYVIPDSQPQPTSALPAAPSPERRGPRVPAQATTPGTFGAPPDHPVISGDAPDGWWRALPAGDTDPAGLRVADLNVGGRRVASATAFRFDGTDYLIEHPADRFGSPDVGRALAALRQLHADTPGAQAVNKHYVVASGPNPYDAYWAQKYNMPDFKSSATAGNGTLTFWNYSPAKGFDRHTFEHETGHNLDTHIGRSSLGADSPEWAAAGRADAAWSSRIAQMEATHPDLVLNGSTLGVTDARKPYPVGVTDYGRSSPLEDFAESNMLYASRVPIARGVIPGEAVARDLTFRDIYPNRATILDQAHASTRRYDAQSADDVGAPAAPSPDRSEVRAAAKKRMADVQAGQRRAAALNEIDELAWRAPGNATALDQVLDVHVAAKALTKADATAIRKAAGVGDRSKLTAVLTRIGARGKLKMSTETAGDLVKFDPDRMRTSDGTVPAADASMRVVRRGAALERDGETIEVEPVLVRPADAAELERDRRVKVSDAEGVASAVATIRHEVATAGPASPDWVAIVTDRANLSPAAKAALVKAAGTSPEALTKSLAATLRTAKIKANGVVNRGVAFDPDTMELGAGVARLDAGTKVKVVETGYTADIDGVPTVVKRTLVEPVPIKVPAQRKAPAKAQPARRPGPTTAIGDDEFGPATRAAANQSLAARVKAGFDESTAVKPSQGISAKTRRVRLADGSYAYRKQALYGDDVNGEYLGNLVSQAIGAPTPGVHRPNKTTLWLEDVPGQTGGQYLSIPGATPLDMHPDGRLIGLSDSLTDISDRNPGNFIYTPAGRVVGIDNYARRLENPMRDGEALPAQGLVGKNAYGDPQNPFVYRGGEGFVERSGDRIGDPDVWRPGNDLTLDEIASMRARLLALKPEFVKLKQAAWHKEIMARFEAVAARSRFLKPDVPAAPALSSAKLRQVEYDAAKEFAGIVSDLEENVVKGASTRAILHKLNARLKRLRIERTPEGYVWRRPGGDVPLRNAATTGDVEVDAARDLAALAEEMDALVTAEAGAVRIIDAARVRAASRGLTPASRAGDVVAFDRKTMDAIGPRPPEGSPALVVRPGYTATLDGELITLERPTVMPTDAPLTVSTVQALPRLATVPTPSAAAKVLNPKYGSTVDGPTYPNIGRMQKTWTSEVGPPPLGAYEENCTNVVNAFEMRMRGLDVEAAPLDVLDWYGQAEGRTHEQVDELFTSAWRLPDGSPHGRTFLDLPWRSFEQIDLEVESWPHGARGTISVGNHIFSVVNEKGKAVYYEGQFDASSTREVTKLYREKYRVHHEKADEAKVIRLDDLVPTDAILQAVRPRSLA